MNNVIIGVVVVALLAVVGTFVFMDSEAEPSPMPEVEMVTETPTNTNDAEDVTSNMDTMEPEMDIVETAIANEDFNTLVTAVTAAELVEVLQSEGPFTVFAPIDAAFGALPEGTVDTLLLPENQADLQGVLTYHVVSGTVLSSDLSDGMTATTVQGADVTIGISDAGATVNDASIIAADIMTSNGVIHVIDSVLLPPTE